MRNGFRRTAARAAAGVALGALALPLLAGCGAGSVPAADVEEQVSSVLEQQVGQAPDDVSCPDDLPGEVGAEMRCELTAGSDTLGLTVTVTSVENNQVDFDVAVDEMPAE